MPYGTVQADVIQSSVPGVSLGAGNATVFKNRIINGDMRIDQRNAGASVATTVTDNKTYTLDRWAYWNSAASKYTVQQNAGSVTPPVGFINYLGCTSTSAYSVGAGDYFMITQQLEGLNVSDLDWGTANAKTITLSFWVRSSLTGTFGGALTNSPSNRSYPFTYTISAANTWEQKTVTIAGDTTGTWLTTNGIGIQLRLGLGVGATLSGTAGAWAAANYASATGATSIVGTNGATFYITGVQLEVGSLATGFEFRDYTTQLSMCKRYFDKTFTINTAPVTNGGRSGAIETLQVRVANQYTVSSFFRFTVPMRTTPTMVFYSPTSNSNQVRNLDTATDCTNTATDNMNEIGGKVVFVSTAGSNTTDLNSVNWTASAEL